MIVRITARLARKIGIGTPQILGPHANPFADWSARVFFVKRSPHLLLTNTSSLYSFVMPAKGVTKPAAFLETMEEGLRSFMENEGQASVFDRYLAPEVARVQFAKAANASVTGSMNDFVRVASVMLTDGEMSPPAVSSLLNGISMGALKHGRPREAFLALRPPEA